MAVKGKRDTEHDNICSNIGTVDEFNNYFASIASDPNYDAQQIASMISVPCDSNSDTFCPLYPYEIE